jgi:hypothetical protein
MTQDYKSLKTTSEEDSMTPDEQEEEKKAKERMLRDMLSDLPKYLTTKKIVDCELVHDICDTLIRKGWRKTK